MSKKKEQKPGQPVYQNEIGWHHSGEGKPEPVISANRNMIDPVPVHGIGAPAVEPPAGAGQIYCIVTKFGQASERPPWTLS
jgi:hypothetical protein